MLLGGLWHGAGWTFIIWGVAHGTFLIINHLWKELNTPLPNFIAKPLTLLAVVVAWVIFRSPDMETASNILSGMFGFNGIVLPLKYEKFLGILNHIGITFGMDLRATHLRVYDLLAIAILFIGALILPNSQEWLEKFKRHPKRWGVPIALLFVFTLLNVDDMTEFLYYQF
jgi:alginate O-acetyltransferase complex protein AlgI